MKKLEEKAQAYADRKADGTSEVWHFMDEVYTELKDAYMAGATEALASQWRPFSMDNSPYIGQEVLILGETGDVILAKIIDQPIKPFGHVHVWHPEVKCKVTHWLPIPELPKTETL